ncbi:hypothetical protein [Streptomyces hypolithicus]
MSGPLWTAFPGEHRDTLPRIPRQRPRSPRRAADPLDELTDRLADLISAAVHPDEIAAILESDGMTDDHIRLTYGREDSFALAEELFTRVPRAFPEPDAAPAEGSGPWGHGGLAACLLRGLLFALPGLAYVLVAPFVAPAPGDGQGLPPGTGVLLAGALVGWTWNQALAHRAYTWLGLGDRPAAAGALLAGAPAGAVLGTGVAAAVAAWPGAGGAGAVAFAGAQAVYQGAATALLVLGRERLLLSALAPMAAGAALTAAYDVPTAVRAGLLIASGAAVLALTARELVRGGAGGRLWLRSPQSAYPAPPAFEKRAPGRSSRRRSPRRRGSRRRGPRWGSRTVPRGGPPLLRSLPYGAFGLTTGVLVLHAVLADEVAGSPGGAIAAPGAVALTLSMGPAEWLLHRFRRRGDAGLRASTTPRAFRRAAGAALAGCLTGYLAVLLALVVAATLLWPGASVPDAPRVTGLLLIGVMLWTGLLLQAFGAVLAAAAVCGAAALAQTVALFAAPGAAHSVALAVPGAGSAVLAALACVLLGRATAHRP